MRRLLLLLMLSVVTAMLLAASGVAAQVTSEPPSGTGPTGGDAPEDVGPTDRPPVGEAPIEPGTGKDVAGVVAEEDPGTNDEPSTVENPKTGISIHCGPGFELVKGEDPSGRGDQCAPMDEEASASGAVKAEEEEVSEGITTTAPENDDTSAPKVISADDGAGQTADSPTVHGCPNADDFYDEDFDICLPNLETAEILFGDEPWPDTAGGYVSLLGGYNNDTLDSFGALIQLGGMALGDALVEFGKDGGPIGWGIQGVGHTVGFVGEVGGGLLLGVNTVTDAVHEGLGAAVDAIGDAAKDAWDTVSGWF